MKKVICINDCGWYYTRKFLGIKYNVSMCGPSYGDILVVKKEDDGFYYFHEWDNDNYNKSQFIELTDGEVREIEKNKLSKFFGLAAEEKLKSEVK